MDDHAAPLRVLMVTPRFHPLTGGVETHVAEVGRRLVAMGIEVTVLTTDLTSRLPAREVLDGIVVERVSAIAATGDLHLAPGLARAIQRVPSRLVHVQGYHTIVPPLAMAAAALRSIPYVVTFHSGGHSSGLRNAIRPVQTALLGPLLRRADGLVAVSRFEANLFARRLHVPDGRIAVIPNGADLPPSGTDRLDAGEGPRSASDQVADGAGQPTIVSLGRLERYKGHHRVIAALPHVVAELPDVRLEIIGGGPYESALRRAATDAGVADRVTIRAIPAGDRAGMSRTLSRASVVAVLSEYESQGIGAYEALAAGAPVLASTSSALAELGASGRAALVDLAVSDREIAAALLRAMRGPRPIVPPELPTWDVAAASLSALYAEVMQNRRGAVAG